MSAAAEAQLVRPEVRYLNLVVLECPSHWSARTVHALAERLRDQELPEAVGVYYKTAATNERPAHVEELRAVSEDDE